MNSYSHGVLGPVGVGTGDWGLGLDNNLFEDEVHDKYYLTLMSKA